MTKKEMMQFFNSTENRFGNENLNVTRNVQLGPGSYDLNRGSLGRQPYRLNTAAFLGKRSDNLFSVKDVPGPGEYS